MITLDMERVGRYFSPKLELPPLDLLAIPDAASGHHLELVNTLVGRSYLKRFLQMIRSMPDVATRTSDHSAGDYGTTQELVDGLLLLPAPSISELFSGPEITTLVNAENRGLGLGPERALAECARVLLPAIAAGAADYESRRHRLTGAVDRERTSIPLLGGGMVIATSPPQAPIDGISVAGGSVTLHASRRKVLRFRQTMETAFLEHTEDGYDAHPIGPSGGVAVGPLEPLWVDSRISGSPEPATHDEAFGLVLELNQTLAKALVLMESVWPAAYQDTTRSVRRVLPLSPRLKKLGYTAHQSRGVVWSKPVLTQQFAQILVHEGGHNLLCSVIDLCALAENQRAIVHSPIGEQRPLYGVFHAAISFTREAIFAQRLLANGYTRSMGLTLEAYQADVAQLARASVDLLSHDAQMSDAGRALTAGLARGLQTLDTPVPVPAR